MVYWIVVFLVCIAAACSSDAVNPADNCTADELYDQVNKECVPRYRDLNNTADTGNNQNNVTDMSADTPEDEGNNQNNVDPCDRDGDGVQSMNCGGDDCNDESRQMSPLLNEFCDELDNDCSGVLNDGIDCSFYAHSFDTLYLVDVFLKTAEIASTNLPDPSLLDIDTHPNGLLYGINREGLWRYDEGQDRWEEIGQFGINITGPNGLAIDSQGTMFLTAGSEIYTVDLDTGAAQLLGDMGPGFIASGDCVVNKLDTLYMTSKDEDDTTPDELVFIDRATAVAQTLGPINDGPRNFSNVFALTAAFGQLYGLTSMGELIKINGNDGSAELLHTFPNEDDPGENIRFFGAASTPDR